MNKGVKMIYLIDWVQEGFKFYNVDKGEIKLCY